MKLLPILTVLLLTALPAPAADALQPLLNGKDVTGWHLRKPDGFNSWKVEDGILKNVVEKGQHGTDLVSDAKFWNFTVRFEYKVPDGSNSGFYLRGRHEIQILGDYKSGKPAEGGNGAIYKLAAPAEFASKPADEWQTCEATIIGNKITVILNGKKIHDNVVCDRGTGSHLDNNVNQPGPILLQGDHGTVWFRKIEMKELPKG